MSARTGRCSATANSRNFRRSSEESKVNGHDMKSIGDSKPGWGGAGRSVIAVTVAVVLLVWIASLGAQQGRAPTKIEAGSCLDAGCHESLAAAKTVHRPVKKKDCDICHEMDDPEVHEFTFPDTSDELCYACHNSVTKKKKFVHSPLKEKKFPCMGCHDPHSSEGEGLLKAPAAADLCLQCHTDMNKAGMYHTSAEAKGCVGCHDPHASTSPKHLRQVQPDLCNSCHTDLAKAIASSKVVHGPVALDCASCHNPHEVLKGKGLKKTGPALCMSCHEHFSETASAMAASHPQLLKDDGCRRCHDPHAGPNQKMLRDSPQKLCLTCHAKDVKASDGRVIRNLAFLTSEDDKAVLHGPLKTGGCSPCHEPHGNRTGSFLRKAYPKTFYSDYSPKAYELCFSCHDAPLASEASSTATKFRDGRRNLHFVHVNKARKGRKCDTCHPPHVSTTPEFVRESVPFGSWDLPIGFAATETGGSCTPGCHEKFVYDRDRPPPSPKSSDQPSAGADGAKDGSAATVEPS
ncbi:MAG TPA: hypothetical protein ENH80_14145 [Phycisphaerae bacterium]|nr:hypothetical protein [Phycisphaerae bacterium]HDZ45069.1 hypothetical protein [Phycisphaerae bacterium]